MNCLKYYEYWLNSKIIAKEFKDELMSLENSKDIEDRFYKELEFGTGGLRGIMGAGRNRMNIYTVGRATEGLAAYLLKNYNNPTAVIAYDSRNNSEKFAKKAALTLCANNIKTYLFTNLRATPILSFALRFLNCSAGIVITASHNPKEYNGYKVYGDDGGQITDSKAKEIMYHINNIKDYEDIKMINEKEAIEKGFLYYIGEEIDSCYFEKVKKLTLRKELIRERAQELRVIYTPLYGSGNIPIRRILKELGYNNLLIVKDQEGPNGDFPTIKLPNPEDPSAFNLAMKMAAKEMADLIIATDPDCDRIGVVTKNKEGKFIRLTGNETGILLTNYILRFYEEKKVLPYNPIILKTIVTTDGIVQLCKELGVEIQELLTGFKYIGERINEIAMKNVGTFLFAFEERCGYLTGDFVRDKDGIIAAVLICEMALYYKKLGKTLYEALTDFYNIYGYYKEELINIEFKGIDGQCIMEGIFQRAADLKDIYISNNKLYKKINYFTSEERDLIENTIKKVDLPRSRVIKFVYKDGSWIVLRPSGTEPKLKIYLSTKGINDKEADDKLKELKSAVNKFIILTPV